MGLLTGERPVVFPSWLFLSHIFSLSLLSLLPLILSLSLSIPIWIPMGKEWLMPHSFLPFLQERGGEKMREREGEWVRGRGENHKFTWKQVFRIASSLLLDPLPSLSLTGYEHTQNIFSSLPLSFFLSLSFSFFSKREREILLVKTHTLKHTYEYMMRCQKNYLLALLLLSSSSYLILWSHREGEREVKKKEDTNRRRKN